MLFNQAKLRIPGLTTLPKAALAFGLITGSLALSAGSANANVSTKSCTFAGGVAAAQKCSEIDWNLPASKPEVNWLLGDKLFRLIDPTLPGLTEPGQIDFVWLDPDDGVNTYLDDSWTVAVIFDDPITGEPGNPLTGYLDYTLEVTKPGWRFESVALDSDATVAGEPTDVIVTKTIENLVLTSIDGVPDGPVPLGGTFITVRDDFSVKNTGTLTSFTNTYTQVPGPLPVLGAGAAFGFSRKLRNRIKKARLA